MRYLSAEQVLFIHARVIDETGGAHGVRDLGLLQSAVSRPQATYGGHDLYPDVFHKAAALMESLIGNHPFLDGNKRTAVSAAGLFLLRNGYALEASQRELETFTLDLVLKKGATEAVTAWFRRHSASKR